ncbi:unnamed protein product [Orchesella dallaii]|uniref:Uncharacterized protein n=1 Tax=Orchesella dallaii TaxID=48710 RepID=A0ABP1RV90_9HEXA
MDIFHDNVPLLFKYQDSPLLEPGSVFEFWWQENLVLTDSIFNYCIIHKCVIITMLYTAIEQFWDHSLAHAQMNVYASLFEIGRDLQFYRRYSPHFHTLVTDFEYPGGNNWYNPFNIGEYSGEMIHEPNLFICGVSLPPHFKVDKWPNFEIIAALSNSLILLVDNETSYLFCFTCIEFKNCIRYTDYLGCLFPGRLVPIPKNITFLELAENWKQMHSKFRYSTDIQQGNEEYLPSKSCNSLIRVHPFKKQFCDVYLGYFETINCTAHQKCYDFFESIGLRLSDGIYRGSLFQAYPFVLTTTSYEYHIFIEKRRSTQSDVDGIIRSFDLPTWSCLLALWILSAMCLCGIGLKEIHIVLISLASSLLEQDLSSVILHLKNRRIIIIQWLLAGLELDNYGYWKVNDLRSNDEPSESIIQFNVSKPVLEASTYAGVSLIVVVLSILALWKLCSTSQRRPPATDEEKLEKLPPPPYEPPPSYDECV